MLRELGIISYLRRFRDLLDLTKFETEVIYSLILVIYYWTKYPVLDNKMRADLKALLNAVGFSLVVRQLFAPKIALKCKLQPW